MNTPRLYFLIPRLVNPELENASGGIISNIQLIINLAKSFNIIVIPMIYSSNPFIGHDDSIRVIGVPFKASGRLRYIIERYLLYKIRVGRVVEKYGKGAIITTRASISIGSKISKKNKYSHAIIVRAFEDMEQAGLMDYSDKVSILRRLEGLISKRNIIQCFLNSDLIITNSNFMKEFIKSKFSYTKKIFVIHPKISLLLHPIVKKNIKNIGFINKGTRKGIDFVINLAKNSPEFTYKIFGEIVHKVDMPSNLANLGFVNDRDLIFGSCDLFIMPSTWEEPYGRVASEAIFYGNPVLVSKKGGLVEAAPNSLFWQNDQIINNWLDRIRFMNTNEGQSLVIEALLDGQNIINSRQNKEEVEISNILNDFLVR
jgi:glycosyltransferase involved in cell wall biosynthesis